MSDSRLAKYHEEAPAYQVGDTVRYFGVSPLMRGSRAVGTVAYDFLAEIVEVKPVECPNFFYVPPVISKVHLYKVRLLEGNKAYRVGHVLYNVSANQLKKVVG